MQGTQHEDEKGGELCDATIESNHNVNVELNHQCRQQTSIKSAHNMDL